MPGLFLGLDLTSINLMGASLERARNTYLWRQIGRMTQPLLEASQLTSAGRGR
jgi:hypothetical protein